MKRWIQIVLLGVSLAACDAVGPEKLAPENVVEAYLEAEAPLPPVRLSRTAPLEGTYDVPAQGLSGAVVRLALLDERGRTEAAYLYREVGGEPGVYRPLPHDATVLPGRTYALDVTLPQGDAPMRAQTTVPGSFRLTDANRDTVVFQSTEQLELTFTRSTYAGRDRSYFIFTTEALDAREEQLTPLARRIYEESDGDVTLNDLRRRASPILNEGNYDANPDGTLTVRFPWLAVLFYGPNLVSASTLDDNLYDFIRTQSIQQGGSTLSPGEIPNVIDHVEGGRGVFGSYARVTFSLHVERGAK